MQMAALLSTTREYKLQKYLEESNCLMGLVSFEMIKMFYNEIEVVIAQHCEYTKCQ